MEIANLTAMELARRIVNKMFENDKFSQWLGISLDEIRPSYARISMTVRNEMLNGFDILHGGITYSLADSALAFASNTLGRISVSIDSMMTYPASAKEGDRLTATAIQVAITNKTAVFDVEIVNQDNVKVGLFRGTVYRTSKEFFPQDN